jgi:hypothetical protein
MTARFAYGLPRVSAKTLAAAKPARTPAAPAASLPKPPLPALKDAFKEMTVFQAGGASRTTIAIPRGEYEHMLSFADESVSAVENACLEASLVLEPLEGSSWTEVVAGEAMLALMLKFQGRRKTKPERKEK